MGKYEVEEYVTERGKIPFSQWLLSLKDKTGQAKLLARIRRATFGNFGDWKEIKGAKGLFEMREHYGPGYRIFIRSPATSSLSCWLDRVRRIRKRRSRKLRSIWRTIGKGNDDAKETDTAI